MDTAVRQKLTYVLPRRERQLVVPVGIRVRLSLRLWHLISFDLWACLFPPLSTLYHIFILGGVRRPCRLSEYSEFVTNMNEKITSS